MAHHLLCVWRDRPITVRYSQCACNDLFASVIPMSTATLNDSYCRVTYRSSPGSFVSLMTLYESNYIRLAHLLGDLAQLPDQQVSHAEGDCPLYAQVDERSRYTTTFTLTYQFIDAGIVVSDPDLQVRVYHDARLGEALHCARWHRHPVFTSLDAPTGESMRKLDERWQRNIMLNKWLDYCAERGHSFAAR
jgi:uncharacterized protein